MIFILDNIRSKFNIWSIFRSCDAFWVEKLILTWICCYPPDKEISKTAIWAEDHVPWQYYQHTKDAINDLKNEWRRIISIETWDNAKEISNFNFNKNDVFIFWNEINWVSSEIQELSDEIVYIPMLWSIKESLNVWVCAGIIWSIASLN